MSPASPSFRFLLAVPLLCACGGEVDLGDFLGFEDITTESGLELELASGVCIEDFDGQHGPDIFFARDGTDRLYLNEGDGSFSDTGVGSSEEFASQGCSAGDFDRDGDMDLVVTALYEATRYFDNDGAGRLNELDVGLEDTFNQRSVLTEDLDGDGWLDLVLTTTQGEQAGLFRNRGDGTFEDLTPNSPLAPIRRTWGGAIFDYDNDGLPDLFLAKDVQPEVDQLLRNDGSFSFADVTADSGVSNTGHAMGIAVADVDADGWLDFYVTNWGHHALWKNTEGEFVDVANAWGVGTAGGASGWGTFFFDADHDGDLDLFVANGAGFLASDPNTPVHPSNEKNRFFLHGRSDDDQPDYHEVGREVGLDDSDAALGAAWGDLDGDGWVDIVVANNQGSSVRVFRNLGTESSGGPPLRIDLHGDDSNPDALGARVVLNGCGVQQVRVRTTGASVLSSGERVLHFGLADCTEDLDVSIHWPSGTVQDLLVPSPEWGDEALRIVEGQSGS